MNFGQATNRAGGRCQGDLQVAARRVIDVHRDGDVFNANIVLGCNYEGARDTRGVLVGDGYA